MADKRRLQGEIDRCLKKVDEGVEVFEDIWKKVQTATNSNQKEKYETDLKKEIKKLQRLRDQIKTWVANSDIKDKQSLVEHRKLIETQMERFKVLERETKTKAYSKDGLGAAAKMDPQTKEKSEITNWLSNQIETLKIQLDQFECELETMECTSKKKKMDKDSGPRADELKQLRDRHKFHIKHLEMAMRAVDNDALAVEQIKSIKDDIDYYVESNQEPDFEENEFLYEDLDLDDLASTQTLGTSPFDSEDHEKLDSNTPQSTNSSSPSPSPSINTNHSTEKVDDKERKRHKSQSEEVNSVDHAAANSINSSSVPVSSSVNSNSVSLTSSGNPSVPSAPSPHLNAVGAPVSIGSSSSSTSGINSIQINSSRPDGSAVMNGPLSAGSHFNFKSQESLSSLQSIAQQAVASAGLDTRVASPSQRIDAAGVFSSSSQAPPQPTAPSPDDQLVTVSSVLTPQVLSVSQVGSSLQTSQQNATPQTTSIQLNPLLGVAPLGPVPFTKENIYQLTMIDAAFHHLPHPSDSERLRHYLPRNPCPTPSFYQQVPPPHADSLDFFSRLSTETLFFIFYYMERHEEPKSITEDYEQGTYIYFDYEKWGQRKKEGFTFEYRYLEDRDLN
ncbi:hypothetical protein BaRGS_00002491 [Batillaria attramentaria]|uniref:CCR4-NOT transcription complex subunit 3 n=1 Tax=Batillaria attramentaria TaxID=370345 RepID=A0ABD0M4T1_9CAEN